MSDEPDSSDAPTRVDPVAALASGTGPASASGTWPESASIVTDILESIDDAVLVLSADGCVFALNRAARAITVIDRAAPLASQHESVVLCMVAAEVLPLVSQVRSGERPAALLSWIERGSQCLEILATPFAGTKVLVRLADVTKREMQRERLVRTEQELRAYLGLTPSSVRLADVSGRILRANDNALAEHEEPRPTTLRELWERDRPRRANDDAEMAFPEGPAMRAAAGLTVRRELITVRRAGSADPRLLESNATPIEDATGRVIGMVLIDRDVTESQHPARTGALEIREDSMSRDRRLAAIGRLAAGIMHDVNNALNPIMAAAYLLRHHAESPDAVRDYADRIKQAAEAGAATASRVGRFIRQEPMHTGTDEVLDLSALAEEVVQLTEPMRPRRPASTSDVQVVREYGADVLTRGVAGEIREALFNLVSNAMDAMATGGTLTVRTSIGNGESLITVQDDGSGMTDEVRERALEPFFTTKGAGGSGLGLAEVYGIARRHRGSVTIDSAPGAGTAVTMHLPVEHGSPTVEVSAETPVKSPPLHILVVEDHEDGREFLCRLLRADGHTADAVGSCSAARERLASDASATYHLMLTDVGLPDGSGWDLVAYARERKPALRVGVITGWEPMVSGGESVGAEFVLRKPLRAAELLAHIAGRKTPALPE